MNIIKLRERLTEKLNCAGGHNDFIVCYPLVTTSLFPLVYNKSICCYRFKINEGSSKRVEVTKNFDVPYTEMTAEQWQQLEELCLVELDF